MHRPKPPWSLWGCLCTAEAGGFRRQSLRNFLPIPSSLFPKKPSLFHMSLYFGKVPTVNPSVTPTACQLPLAREPLRVVPADNFARWLSTNRSFPDPPGIGGLPKAPLAKGGWFGEAKPGGFPRLAGFHIGLYFQEVPPVNPSVTAYAVPAPFGKGAFGWGIVSLQKISQISPAPGELWAFFPGLYGEIQEKCLGFG